MIIRSKSYAIGRRLAWSFALLALVGLGLVGVGVYWMMSTSLEEKDRAEMQSKALLIQHVIEANPEDIGYESLRHRLDDVLIGHDDLQLTLFDGNGKVLYRSHNVRSPNARLIDQRLPIRRATDRSQSVDAVLAMDLDANRRVLTGLAVALTLATLLGATGIALAGSYLVRWGLKPLRQLASQTANLQPGQLDQRLVLAGEADELQPWIQQVNGLLDRLQAAYRQLEGFNADVAHELRTPLATLISRSEVDLSLPRTAEELRETIAHNLEDLGRLSTIVNDMLFLSRADLGATARLDPPASMSSQAAEVVEFHEAAIEEAEVKVHVSGDATFPFDRSLIRRSLSNLLSNATRYAKTGSAIEINISTDGPDAVRIGVVNEGPTIETEQLPRLFDRFYRVEAARDRVGDRYGLGLAIVAAIARMHGGSTFAQSSFGKTTVGLVLPRRGA